MGKQNSSGAGRYVVHTTQYLRRDRSELVARLHTLAEVKAFEVQNIGRFWNHFLRTFDTKKQVHIEVLSQRARYAAMLARPGAPEIRV